MDKELDEIAEELHLSMETVSELKVYISKHPGITAEELRRKISSILATKTICF